MALTVLINTCMRSIDLFLPQSSVELDEPTAAADEIPVYYSAVWNAAPGKHSHFGMIALFSRYGRTPSTGEAS